MFSEAWVWFQQAGGWCHSRYVVFKVIYVSNVYVRLEFKKYQSFLKTSRGLKVMV